MTASSKAAMADTITFAANKWTDGAADPRILISIADRESGFNPHAAADVAAATKVWARLKPQYIEHKNPYTADNAAWEASRGLFQLMVPYHLSKWSWQAHPMVLEHPVVATAVAGRLVHNALLAGAKNAVDVRMVWGFGTDGLAIPHTDQRYTDRVRLERNRMVKLGFPAELALAPMHASQWSRFGRYEQPTQYALAKAISDRLGLGPWAGADTTPHTTPDASASTGLLLLAAAVTWGMLRG